LFFMAAFMDCGMARFMAAFMDRFAGFMVAFFMGRTMRASVQKGEGEEAR